MCRNVGTVKCLAMTLMQQNRINWKLNCNIIVIELIKFIGF